MYPRRHSSGERILRRSSAVYAGTNMKFNEDRRCATIKRVSHTALVDICSLEEEGFPFQGESCNISGRGMHVRGSYLPEIGESLVCRFNHDDEEVLVEGRVAWRSEGEDSGEFGIQFTALDADCAELLRGLGQPVRAQSTLAPVSMSLKEQDDDDSDLELESGERVRLHIEGLGAPMKASVVEGSTRKVKVGSALEFLKMGRSVELEEIVGGQRRGALVDSVNVVIHPTTSVPELVVQLRYEGISPTPAPVKAVARDAAPAQGRAVDDRAFDDAEDHLDHDEEHPWQPTAEALKERFSGAVESAGGLARQANGLLSTLARSVRAKTSSEKPLKKTSTRMTRGAKPERAAAVRRTQAAGRVSQSTPSHLRSGIHDMKLARGAQARTSQPGSRGAAASEKPNSAAPARRRKLSPGLIFAAAFLVLGGSALGFRSLAPDQAKVASSQAHKDLSSQAEQTTSKKSSAQSVAVAPPSPDQDGTQGAVVAEVPLFGQQTVAASRPEVALSKVSDAEAELRAAAAAVGDQSFDEPEEVENMKGDKPWGRGRLYLPTIHRIRLDGAGVALSGAVNSDGFTVVVSGRKVMESGKAIQKRDKRIVAVKADNEGPNAKIRFEFRGPVPPYRVRLRQDFVEFLISAPEETVAHL